MLPEPFVYLMDVAPDIVQEMRYAGHHNFVGRPIPGYAAPHCVVTHPTAVALSRVQLAAQKLGLTLKVYDGYRPQRAVDYFVQWCDAPNDTLMAREFYPELPKNRLFVEGYLSARSQHCTGGAVDVTLVPRPVPAQETFVPGQPLVDGRAPRGVRFGDNSIDMGTGFDVFDELAHTLNPRITGEARDNRRLLCDLMQAEGFDNYAKEWWHFNLAAGTLKTPHDFEIR